MFRGAPLSFPHPFTKASHSRPNVKRVATKRMYTTTGNYMNEYERVRHENNFLRTKENDTYQRLNRSLESVRHELERVKHENYTLLAENVQLKRENQILREKEGSHAKRLNQVTQDIDILKLQLNTANALYLMK